MVVDQIAAITPLTAAGVTLYISLIVGLYLAIDGRWQVIDDVPLPFVDQINIAALIMIGGIVNYKFHVLAAENGVQNLTMWLANSLGTVLFLGIVAKEIAQLID